MENGKIFPTLTNWVIENWGEFSIARGNVYNDSRFTDGEWIKTSYLRRYSLSEKKLTTKNSTFLLGTPHSDYEVPPEQDVACVTQPIDHILG